MTRLCKSRCEARGHPCRDLGLSCTTIGSVRCSRGPERPASRLSAGNIWGGKQEPGAKGRETIIDEHRGWNGGNLLTKARDTAR
jgi:hypothetical protein